MDGSDDKLSDLLAVVIDNYISKGEPIGSKFLNSLDTIDYAPSTLRKYLNLLEKSGFVYQPYNSSGRIPTIDGFCAYIDSYIEKKKQNLYQDSLSLEVDVARHGLRNIVESLAKIVDGVTVGFIRNDEYSFLGINNILKKTSPENYSTMEHIVNFIETREIIGYLSTKIIKKKQIYYTFVQQDDVTFSCLYCRVTINDYDGIISIVWPTRSDYRKNLSVLEKLVQLVG